MDRHPQNGSNGSSTKFSARTKSDIENGKDADIDSLTNLFHLSYVEARCSPGFDQK